MVFITWSRLVRRCSPATAMRTSTKTPSVVGWVRPARNRNRNRAERAPHDVLAGSRKGSASARKYRHITLSM